MGFSGLVLAPPQGELSAQLTERAGDGLPRRGFAPPRNDTLPSLPLGEGAPVGTLGRMRGTPKGFEPLRQNG